MREGIPGNQRRNRQSTSRSSSTTSAASTAAAKTDEPKPGAPPNAAANQPPPPPPPAPEPTVHQRFTKELALILVGKRSDPNELYCPLAKLDEERHHAICVVDDSITRELFSFSQKLAEQYQRVPLAKNADEVEKMEHAKAVLKRQVETVREVVYQHLCAAHRELADLDRPIELLDGWVVASIKHPTDDMRMHLIGITRVFSRSPDQTEDRGREES